MVGVRGLGLVLTGGAVDEFAHPELPPILFDLETDPDELHDVADQPQYQAALLEMKSATAALAHAERGPARRALGVHPAVTDYAEVVICGKK